MLHYHSHAETYILVKGWLVTDFLSVCVFFCEVFTLDSSAFRDLKIFCMSVCNFVTQQLIPATLLQT